MAPWQVGGQGWCPSGPNRSEPTGTYVCSRHTAYIRYAREELTTLPARQFDLPLRGLIATFDHLLRLARIDDFVHLNNWLLSTNLVGGLDVEDGQALANDLAAAFPRSLLALRLLNNVAHACLIERLQAGGWVLLPSRQIYLIADIERDWRPRTEARHDRVLIGDGRYSRDEIAVMSQRDAERIAALSPAFTPAFIELTHALGMIRYVGLRDAAGRLRADRQLPSPRR